MTKIEILNIGHEKVYNKKGKVIAYIKVYPIFDKSDRFSVTRTDITIVTFAGEIPGYVDTDGVVFTPDNRYIGCLKKPRRTFFQMSVVSILLIFLTISILQTTVILSKMGMSLLEPEVPEITVNNVSDGVPWSERMNINVLGNQSIYPGANGSYLFVVNNQNEKPILHNVAFREINKNNIPIRYRIKVNELYISEDWQPISYIDLENIYLSSETRTLYCIEWRWAADIDDGIDSLAGQDITTSYTIQIAVVAELAL